MRIQVLAKHLSVRFPRLFPGFAILSLINHSNPLSDSPPINLGPSREQDPVGNISRTESLDTWYGGGKFPVLVLNWQASIICNLH